MYSVSDAFFAAVAGLGVAPDESCQSGSCGESIGVRGCKMQS